MTAGPAQLVVTITEGLRWHCGGECSGGRRKDRKGKDGFKGIFWCLFVVQEQEETCPLIAYFVEIRTQRHHPPTPVWLNSACLPPTSFVLWGSMSFSWDHCIDILGSSVGGRAPPAVVVGVVLWFTSVGSWEEVKLFSNSSACESHLAGCSVFSFLGLRNWYALGWGT